MDNAVIIAFFFCVTIIAIVGIVAIVIVKGGKINITAKISPEEMEIKATGNNTEGIKKE